MICRGVSINMPPLCCHRSKQGKRKKDICGDLLGCGKIKDDFLVFRILVYSPLCH